MRSNVLRWVAFALLCLIVIMPFGSVASREIQWHTYKDGMARGKFEKKRVFIHFYADWCAACKSMEKNTFSDPVVITAFNENFIPIKVDADREVETATMFRVKALPDNWFVGQDGEIIGHRPGYIPPDQLKTILKLIMSEGGEEQQ